jgi:probable rRNA maturation factor
MMPQLSLYDRQSAHALPLAQLQAWAEQALPLCLAEAAVPSGSEGQAPDVLAQLDEVEICFIDDAAIADVHESFMGDPTPTDVITFHHGEILISTETAARQATAHGQSFDREVFRYLVHGLLHLRGHTDADPALRAAMHQVQERIVEELSE